MAKWTTTIRTEIWPCKYINVGQYFLDPNEEVVRSDAKPESQEDGKE